MAYTEASLNINNEFEDEEVPVFYCEFEFNRKIDIKTGHARSGVHAGLMQVVVEGTKKMLLLLDLMLRSEKFNGKITFKRDTSTGVSTKTVKFTNAVCVDYRETFDTNLIGGMRLNFSIWFETIDIDNTQYNVKWKAENEQP